MGIRKSLPETEIRNLERLMEKAKVKGKVNFDGLYELATKVKELYYLHYEVLKYDEQVSILYKELNLQEKGK